MNYVEPWADQIEKIMGLKMDGDGQIRYLVKLFNQPLIKCRWIRETDSYSLPEELKNEYYGQDVFTVNIKQIRGRGRPVKHWEKREEFLRIKDKVKLVTTGEPDKIQPQLKKKRERLEYNAKEEEDDDHSIFNDREASTIDDDKGYESKAPSTKFLPEEVDVPRKLKQIQMINGKMCYLVNWKSRSNGVVPEDSYVPAETFRKKYRDFKDLPDEN